MSGALGPGDLDRLLAEVVPLVGEAHREALGDSVAEALRGGAQRRVAAAATRSSLLRVVARGYEAHALHAVGFGFALWEAQRELGHAGDRPSALEDRLRRAEDPRAEAVALARELAKPYSSQAPDPRLLELFSPGLTVWRALEDWAVAAGVTAARQRLEALFAAAEVEGEDQLERALGRIDLRTAFRFGYLLAVAEPGGG